MKLLLVVVAAALAWWLWEKSRRKTHAVSSGYQSRVELPFEQEFELYHNALSLCSMKVRVGLAELGIRYADRPIELIETGAYENIRPAFLAVNPAGGTRTPRAPRLRIARTDPLRGRPRAARIPEARSGRPRRGSGDAALDRPIVADR